MTFLAGTIEDDASLVLRVTAVGTLCAMRGTSIRVLALRAEAGAW